MKELKQYIEKELQAKKFLQDGLDLVTEVEQLATQKKELGKEIPQLQSKYAAAKHELDKVESQIVDAIKSLKNKEVEASLVIENAELIAKAIEKDARAKAEAIIEGGNNELKAIGAEIEIQSRIKTDLIRENKLLEKENQTIRDAKQKLLEKLGG